MASTYICTEKARTYSGSGEQKKYYRTFWTRWDAGDAIAAQTEAAIFAQFAVTYQSSHPENPIALATEVDHEQDSDNPTSWTTRFTFEQNRKDKDDQQRSIANPTERPPRVSMYWEPIRTPVPDDRDGEIIRNSAGQVPDPRVEVDGMLRGFHIEGDRYPMPSWVWEYADRRGCINNAPFQVRLETGQLIDIGLGCAAIRNLRTSTLKYENSYPHYNISFDLLYREAPIKVRVTHEGWVFDLVDAGMMQIADEIPADTDLPVKLKHILDANGNEVSSPVLLNGAGLPLEDPTVDEPVVLYHNVIAARTFGGVLPACI